MGAMMLLFRTRGRSLAALGAVLIVLLLAIDTFFQQVVALPDRWARQNTPSAIPRAVIYNPPYTPAYFQGWEEQQNEQNIEPIVQRFLYDNGTQAVLFGNGTRPDIPLSCPTSNCTWPDYETLAICSKCTRIEVAELLTYACKNTTIDWSAHFTGPIKPEKIPNGTVCGYFVNATSSAPILMSGYVVNETNNQNPMGEALLVRTLPLTTFLDKEILYGTGSINFKHIRNPILDTLVVSARNGASSVYHREEPTVEECVLSWCVQTIRSSYDSGKYKEEIISTFENTTAGPSPWESSVIPEEEGGGQWIVYNQNITIEPPKPNHTRSDSTISNTTYGASNLTAANLMYIFNDFFPSYYTADDVSSEPTLRYKNYPVGPHIKTLDFNAWQAPNNITQHMDRLATAMTNVLRSATSREMLAGEAFQIEVYVQIRWEWMTFPLLLLLLSLLFLVSTIIKTSGDGATGMWKTSAMPTLIYSLPKETQGQFASSSTWSSGKGAPRKTRIKLLPNLGWRVSGQSHLSLSPRLPSKERVPRGWI